MQLAGFAKAFVAGAEYQQESFRLYLSPLRQHILFRLRHVIAYAEAGKVNLLVVCIVKLYPIAVIAVGIGYGGSV